MSLGCSSKISCVVLVPEEFVISLRIPSKLIKSGHYRPTSKTPSERCFAGGPIVARDWILAEHIICRGRPLNSFAVSRAADSIDPDQTEPTLFAKIFLKCSSRRQNRQVLLRLAFFGFRDFVCFQNVMLFSEKCADPDEKSFYACGNSSRPSESTKGKQNYSLLLLGRKLRPDIPQHVSTCSKYSNGEYLTLCMLSNVVFLS